MMHNSKIDGEKQQPGSIVTIRNLGVKKGNVSILEGLDLDVNRGEVLGLVGASGTGKSVLLRTILGLNAYHAGTISLFDQELQNWKQTGFLELCQRWGVLFQDSALLSSLTVRQNIQIPMREHMKLAAATMDSLADLKISMVGLPASSAEKFPWQLSGGMRKRAGLARALALDPQIVMLDEPTAGLDPIGAAAFDSLILKLKRTLGFTVIMATHDLDSLYRICDRIAVLGDRKVLIVGTIDEIREFQHDWVQDYFYGERATALFGALDEA